MINEETFKSLFGSILDRAKEKRQQSDLYKDLFAVSGDNDISGLLRELENRINELVLSAVQVISDKHNVRITNDKFAVLQCIVYFKNYFSKTIREEEGSACCVDKAYHLLSKMILEEGEK